MTAISKQHREDAPNSIRCAVVTISDTRSFETDQGGETIIEYLQQQSHRIAARHLVPDEPDELRPLLHALAARDDVDAILMTGGTGISRRDQTCETVTGLLETHLPGYGELFRMLSYAEVGAAAMLSRATGGLMRGTVVLTMPGSPKAVRLAMEKIILPELGHLVREARHDHHRPYSWNPAS